MGKRGLDRYFNWNSFGGGVIITLAVGGGLYLVLKVVLP